MARKSTLSRTLKFMLALCGIWPDSSYVLFCRIFWIVTMAILLFCHCLYFLKHIVQTIELMDLMDCVSCFFAYSKIIIKFFVLWLNQRKFVETLAMMAEDWHDNADSEIGMQQTICKAKLSDRITNTVLILQTLSVIGYGSRVIFADVDVTDHTTELPFISKLEIPFDINTQRTYRFLLITQFLHMILCGWAGGITNSLLLTLILHAAGQIDIIRCWVTQLVSQENGDKHESIAIATKKIIQKHQKIINFSENIESLYTYIALLQFISNTIMICSLGFLIAMAIGSPNAVEQILRFLFFYTVTNLEAFIFCFAGEYLKNKSSEIGIAVYNCAWYDLKPKESRLLLFIILRSQKQLTLTTGKIMNLSLQTFTSIINASGSYLSMLLAIQ